LEFADKIINHLINYFLINWLSSIALGTPTGSSNSSSHSTPRLSQTNLYIRGLSPETTDKDLVTLCQPWVAALNS